VILTNPRCPRPFLETPPTHFAGFPSVITFCIPDKTGTKISLLCPAPKPPLCKGRCRATRGGGIDTRNRRPLQGLPKHPRSYRRGGNLPPAARSALASLSYALRAAFGGCATHAHCGGCDEGGGICGANDGGRENERPSLLCLSPSHLR